MLGCDVAGIVALEVIQNQFCVGRQPSDILGAVGCKRGAESVRRERDAGRGIRDRAIISRQRLGDDGSGDLA